MAAGQTRLFLSRRNFLELVFLGSAMPALPVLSVQSAASSDELIVREGWVLRASDLRPLGLA
jgi:hypothetical protein